MKKLLFAFFISVLLFSSLACNITGSKGEQVFNEARELEKSADYIKALVIYKRAKPLLIIEGKKELADQCRFAFTRINNITMTYPYNEEQFRKIIKDKYPGTTDARIDELIKDGRMPQMKIDGTTYYFSEFTNTLYHVYPDFRKKEEAGALGKNTELFEVMSPYIYNKDQKTPITYMAEGKVIVPRAKLAKKGLLKVWVPLPLVTAAQQEVEILSVYPKKYIKYPLKKDGDIGITYMEVPLEELKKNLQIGLKIKFKHFEERFNVNPKMIGAYDKESELYKRYTKSYKNTTVTDSIRATAKKIAGDETNPYIIAKKFYDHIVYNLDYSYTPHGALDALKIPESVFVHEHGYGDCGAQSMYFSALCRAAGIPARTSGGYQLFPMNKTGCGTHFWAQIYLPNYGWMPVDTSVGQIAKYISNISEKQKKDYIEYFYGQMDPFRYLIQKDVDIALIPPANEPLVFSIVLQTPTAICAEMDENPGMLFMDNWVLKVREIKQP